MKRKIKFYNLDVIIATGYRINSVIGTNFRIWAIKTLREHITIDPKAVLELVKEFSSTWMSLDAYDKEPLATVGTTKRSIALSSTEPMVALITQLLR